MVNCVLFNQVIMGLDSCLIVTFLLLRVAIKKILDEYTMLILN